MTPEDRKSLELFVAQADPVKEWTTEVQKAVDLALTNAGIVFPNSMHLRTMQSVAKLVLELDDQHRFRNEAKRFTPDRYELT